MSKLTEKEQIEIQDLIKTYRTLHEQFIALEAQINDVSKKMQEMHGQKDELVNSITNNRDYENTYVKILVEKYGEGRLDIETMEWITNDSNTPTQ